MSMPTEHWAIAEGCRGIELAQVVVVNARTEGEREPGEGPAGGGAGLLVEGGAGAKLEAVPAGLR